MIPLGSKEDKIYLRLTKELLKLYQERHGYKYVLTTQRIIFPGAAQGVPGKRVCAFVDDRGSTASLCRWLRILLG